jgi:hypothetical protein
MTSAPLGPSTNYVYCYRRKDIVTSKCDQDPAFELYQIETTPAPPSQCGKTLPKPGLPLSQVRRPPQQTPQQYKVQQLNIKNAAAQSAAAKGWLQNYLQTPSFKKEIADLSIANSTTDELIEMLVWEFKRLAIIHNGPLIGESKGVQDDSDLETTRSNGYLQNVCQVTLERQLNFQWIIVYHI